MAILKTLNLLVSFLLELAILAAVGHWGFTTATNWIGKLGFGLGGPLLIAVLWGIFGSPRAAYPLRGGVRLVFDLIIFGAAPAALFATHQPTLAWSFIGIYLVNRLLIGVWQQ